MMRDKALPKEGWSRDRILTDLDQLRSCDVRWSDGVIQGFVYHPDDDVVDIAVEAIREYYDTNAMLTRRGFVSMGELRTRLVAIGSDLMHASGQSGLLTTGGTESNMLAVWAAVKQARGRGHMTRPNIVLPYSAHPCLHKAAMFFGIEVRCAELADDSRVDLDSVSALIDEETILLVGSAPEYSHGVVDPIPELGQMALEAGLPLHVDACVGGFILPFVERLGRKVPPWDFRVPGVSTISADIHKHGYGPKGASLLLTDTDERARLLRWEFDRWPQGQYITENVVGSRSGAVLAGAWATLMALGEDGYMRITKDIMELTDRFQVGIAEIDGLYVLGSPPASKFAYSSAEVDMFAVADVLEANGWVVARQANPEAIGMHVLQFHRGAVNRYLNDLEDAVGEVRAGRITRSGAAATYN